jgi:hypothetical protein
MARRLPERRPVADITAGNVITVEADDITGVPAPRLPDYFVFIARRLECDEGKGRLEARLGKSARARTRRCSEALLFMQVRRCPPGDHDSRSAR